MIMMIFMMVLFAGITISMIMIFMMILLTSRHADDDYDDDADDADFAPQPVQCDLANVRSKSMESIARDILLGGIH